MMDYPASLEPHTHDQYRVKPANTHDQRHVKPANTHDQRHVIEEDRDLIDVEERLRQLNAKVERVTSQTHLMLDRTSSLSHTSRALNDQIAGLQHGLRHINQNLR